MTATSLLSVTGVSVFDGLKGYPGELMPVERIIERLPSKSDQELLEIFSNVRRLLAKRENADAQKMKEAIEAQWRDRTNRARVGNHRTTKVDAGISGSPAIGVLKSLGYSVGETKPVPQDERRWILRHIVEGHLPLVDSSEHMDEWGEPGTEVRFRKLVNTLFAFESGGAHRNNAKAKKEWRDDLAWLGATYPGLGSVPIALL